MIVMLSFGRSGGTVLNQCLGCLPNTVCLSEVNPVCYSYASVKSQAKNWHGISLRSNDFTEGILELEQICDRRGLSLIVRDWSYVSFVSRRWNWGNVAGKLLILDILEKRTEIVPFAFIRDAIDVWISFYRHNAGSTAPPDQFGTQYLLYVWELLDREIKTFRYEDFCNDPETTIRQICTYTGLEYSDSYQQYAEFTKVYGDTSGPAPSRGILQGEIAPLPRVALPSEMIRQIDESSLVTANQLLGYPLSYGGSQ